MVATAAAASAARSDGAVTPATAKTYPYAVAQRFWSKDLKRCINVKLVGEVKVSVAPYKTSIKSWKKPKLTDPVIEVGIGNKCAKGAKHVKLSGLDIQQNWYHTACNLSPSIAAGVPWGIQVGITPDCGSEKTGERGTSYSKNDWKYKQSNSGNPVYWKKTTHSKKLCLGASTSGTAYVGSRSDSFVLTNYKVCVTP